MTIGRDEILGLVPHQGGMCLLDEVLAHDESRIECRTRTHLDPANPLRHGGRLAAVHLAEYGAQAMAIHGGLLGRAGGQAPKPGLLVTLRDFRLEVARLDDLGAPLTVTARKLLANPDGQLYAFEVQTEGRRLASGRVGVIQLPRPQLPGPL